MYICICKQVTDKQIKAAIDEGAQSVRDLRSKLGVASQCGQCGQCVKGMLKEHAVGDISRLPRSKQRPSTTPADIFPLFRDTLFASD